MQPLWRGGVCRTVGTSSRETSSAAQVVAQIVGKRMAVRVVRVFLHGYAFEDCEIITILFLFIAVFQSFARNISELDLSSAVEGMQSCVVSDQEYSATAWMLATLRPDLQQR